MHGSFLCAVLAGSWALWAGTDIRDHLEIRALKAQLAKYDASTVEEHEFRPLARLEDGDFAYVSDEKRMGDIFRPCPVDAGNKVDAAAILDQAIEAGVTAERARWEERGVCRSILRADLGFWWRDLNNKFKYTGGE